MESRAAAEKGFALWCLLQRKCYDNYNYYLFSLFCILSKLASSFHLKTSRLEHYRESLETSTFFACCDSKRYLRLSVKMEQKCHS